jgi:hypothetical protein
MGGGGGGGTLNHERKKVSGKTGGRKWERRNVGEGGKRMKERKKERTKRK